MILKTPNNLFLSPRTYGREMKQQNIYRTKSRVSGWGKLLIDAFGSSLEDVIHELKEAGVKTEKFRPFQIGKISRTLTELSTVICVDDCVAYVQAGG